MARVPTPFDEFIAQLLEWLDGAWFVWASLGIAIALVVVIVTISKLRARARARVPQYRRTAT